MIVTAVSPDCRWRALPDPAAAWVTVDDTQHVGRGAFEIAAASNAGASRIATLLVAGLPLQVTQARGGPISYYLAEGATGSDLDLDIVIANPNPVDAPISIRFLTPAGVAVARDLTLGALRRTTIRVNEIAGLESTAVSTEVTSVSGAPWSSSGRCSGTRTATAGTAARPWTGRARDGISQRGSRASSTRTSSSRIPATRLRADVVTFLLEREPPVTVDMAVGAGERASSWAGSVPALAARAFGILVEADQPVVAERAMYFGAGRTWAGGHESAGVTAPATEWFLAEGATGDYFDTYVLVGNPNDDPVDVAFTFLLPDGRTVNAARSIAGHARLTVPVEREHLALAHGIFDEGHCQRPRHRRASGVLAWRRVEVGRGPQQLRRHRGGHAVGACRGARRRGPGVRDLHPGREPLERDGRRQGHVSLSRPGSDPPDVHGASNEPVQHPARRPHGAARRGPHFGAIVESLNGVPIVVERAMYRNAGAEAGPAERTQWR